ncbi:dnc [Symbiodinium sp. CCMP2592]|nr:dnc [Symbiodinium sp. CCMP2592]
MTEFFAGVAVLAGAWRREGYNAKAIDVERFSGVVLAFMTVLLMEPGNSQYPYVQQGSALASITAAILLLHWARGGVFSLENPFNSKLEVHWDLQYLMKWFIAREQEGHVKAQLLRHSVSLATFAAHSLKPIWIYSNEDMSDAFETSSAPGSEARSCNKYGPVMQKYVNSQGIRKTCGGFGTTICEWWLRNRKQLRSDGMERKMRGLRASGDKSMADLHAAQWSASCMAYSASPISPHAPTPDDHVAPAGFEKWVWAELDQELAVMCGLQSVIGDPEAAKRLAADPECKVLQVRLGDVAVEEAIVDGDRYLPDSLEYDFVLPDGLLFGFDVFVGHIDPGERTPRLLEHMRAARAVNSDAFTAPEQILLQDPEFVAGLAPGHGRLPSQMEELPQQQEEEEEEAAAAAAFPAGAARNVPAAWEPSQLNVIERLWALQLEDLPAVPPHVDQENIIKMDTAVGTKTCYGAHGASVQVWPADQTPWLSDREVMQKLLLVGKPEIPLREFASKLCRAKQTPQCFPKSTLEQVVEAGLNLFYPLGKLVSKGKTVTGRQLRNLLIQNVGPRPEAPVE